MTGMKRLFLVPLILMLYPSLVFAYIYAGADYIRWKGSLYDIGYRRVLSKLPEYELLNVKLENYRAANGQKVFNWCSANG